MRLSFACVAWVIAAIHTWKQHAPSIDHNRIRCSSKNCFSEFFPVSMSRVGGATCCVWAQQKKAQRWTFTESRASAERARCWKMRFAAFARRTPHIIKLKTRLNFIYLSGAANDCTKWLANTQCIYIRNNKWCTRAANYVRLKTQVHFAFYLQ